MIITHLPFPSSVKDISVTSTSVYAVVDSGTLYVIKNIHAHMGSIGFLPASTTLELIELPFKISKVNAGVAHIVIIDDGGSLYTLAMGAHRFLTADILRAQLYSKYMNHAF